jgi:hypothetical protein
LGKLLETVTRIHLWVRPNLERPMIDFGGFHMTPAPLEVLRMICTVKLVPNRQYCTNRRYS